MATRTKAAIGKKEGKIDNVIRLEVIKAEEKKILEDKLELQQEIEAKKIKDEIVAKKKQEEVIDIIHLYSLNIFFFTS